MLLKKKLGKILKTLTKRGSSPWRNSMKCAMTPSSKLLDPLIRKFCKIKFLPQWAGIPPLAPSLKKEWSNSSKKSSITKEKFCYISWVFNILISNLLTKISKASTMPWKKTLNKHTREPPNIKQTPKAKNLKFLKCWEKSSNKSLSSSWNWRNSTHNWERRVALSRIWPWSWKSKKNKIWS